MPTIEKVLFDQRTIQRRITTLAQQISKDYSDLVVIVVLNGAMFFASDLLRALSIDVDVDSLSVGRYGQEHNHSTHLHHRPKIDIKQRHVLLVEDIVDSGQTLRYVLDELKQHQPASMKICSLLDKPCQRQTPIEVDYLGFKIDNHWVVGYGLDYQERFRTLPFIAVVKP